MPCCSRLRWSHWGCWCGSRERCSPGLSRPASKRRSAIIKLDSFAAEDNLNRLALLFCLVAGVASLPHLLMRGLVTPSIEEARTSFLWALPFTGVLLLLAAPFLSLFEAAPTQGSPASAILSFGLIAVGAISLLLAVGSGLVLAIANALSYDLYYRSLHLSASTERRILVARAAVVLTAALAAGGAFAAPDVIPLMTGASFSLAASAFLPALLLGVWWKRATGEGALAGMLAGLAVCLYYLLAPRYIPFAFYETSSFLSNATPDEAAHYVALRQGYYLADASGERRPWRHGGRWRSSSPIGAASSAILPPCLPCRSVLR